MKRTILIVTLMAAVTTISGVVSAEDPGKGPQDMIERHDRDGDNRVSSDEFPGPDEHFNRIDTDGDGYISRAEAQNAPRPNDQNSKIPGRFFEDDSDGDGVVSRSEFSGPDDHFDKMDSNGDGVIEKSEAAQGPPDMARGRRRSRPMQ